jgi:hypothetical protein
MRTTASALYWIAAVVIGLGAFGHGFGGVRPVAAAIADSTLPADIVRVIWIVWYGASLNMITCAALLVWAWPSIRTGTASRSAVALIIGANYLVTGLVSYVYSGLQPFWLLFVVLGAMVIGSTFALRLAPHNRA